MASSLFTKAVCNAMLLQFLLDPRTIRFSASISVASPHTALGGVFGGMNDWLASCTCADPQKVPRLETKPATEAIENLDLSQSGLLISAARAPVAICAGSGGSMFSAMGTPADVWFTGEMQPVSRPHSITLFLTVVGLTTGSHVILGHTNTERGYLPLLRDKLRAELDDSDGEVVIREPSAVCVAWLYFAVEFLHPCMHTPRTVKEFNVLVAPIMSAGVLFAAIPKGAPVPLRQRPHHDLFWSNQTFLSQGKPDTSQTIDLGTETLNGGFLIKTLVLSIDAGIRKRMRSPEIRSSTPAFTTSAPFGIGVVPRSENPDLAKRQYIYGSIRR
ncbi:hypothetical protein FB451DRAFT_1567150 [Mycena latifolia]|nr:hypothetical protein FB451DRAFT_1567150 [Mycena latifolia]